MERDEIRVVPEPVPIAGRQEHRYAIEYAPEGAEDLLVIIYMKAEYYLLLYICVYICSTRKKTKKRRRRKKGKN